MFRMIQCIKKNYFYGRRQSHFKKDLKDAKKEPNKTQNGNQMKFGCKLNSNSKRPNGLEFRTKKTNQTNNVYSVEMENTKDRETQNLKTFFFFPVMRTFKIHSLSNFQICNIVLLTIIIREKMCNFDGDGW